jgi:oleate hydratase
LSAQGVQFVLGTQVTDLDFKYGADGKGVERIHYVRDDVQGIIAVGPDDVVFVTNGSMTDAASLGSLISPPTLGGKDSGGSGARWGRLAEDHSDFGRPTVCNGNVAESKWLSFTTTLRDPTFFDLMEKFTGNKPGTGGLVTFTDSNWLMSVVLPYQPHFINQPADVFVFWGYGLFPDEPGNFVSKKMSDCTGEEILVELCRHLRFDEHLPKILASADCVPCMMPFITSQFMPRVQGDRPQIRPTGTTNIAFIGQYCEMPDDVVFTVDYSVRSAQTAVYKLLGVDREVTPIYKGQHDVGVLLRAMRAMLR